METDKRESLEPPMTVIARGDFTYSTGDPGRSLTVLDLDGRPYYFAGPTDEDCDFMANNLAAAARHYGCLLREVDDRHAARGGC